MKIYFGSKLHNNYLYNFYWFESATILPQCTGHTVPYKLD